jgi:hypothetical protein
LIPIIGFLTVVYVLLPRTMVGLKQ